jgi:hypothetical protein
MDRSEIEITLSRDRAWLLEAVAALPDHELARGVTPSEHDASVRWSLLDHLVHLVGIERSFNAMVERHLAGDANPVALARDADGAPRTREAVMAMVHGSNEDWVEQHRGKSLAEVVALGQQARGETLVLLARLSDAQLGERLPGAPWSDGTIGGVLATNAAHGRMHWKWVKEANAAGSPETGIWRPTGGQHR